VIAGGAAASSSIWSDVMAGNQAVTGHHSLTRDLPERHFGMKKEMGR